MDTATQKVLNALSDKAYDRRKVAALELERVIRDAYANHDEAKMLAIFDALKELGLMQNSNAKSGSVMGLAGVAIALKSNITPYLNHIIPPIVYCMGDVDSKVRYFACESMYNVAKVAKVEILLFFNELFDALSKLSSDTELPVKNGAELLDRLLKDIVTEQVIDKKGDATARHVDALSQFIPLLKERILVLNPYTRTYLVSWLTVLDTVPELELVTHLPEFLDGLLKYLGDPSKEIRSMTMQLLSNFLREIGDIASVNARLQQSVSDSEDALSDISDFNAPELQEKAISTHDEDQTLLPSPRPPSLHSIDHPRSEGPGITADWIPGQGTRIDHAAIIEILLQHLTYTDEELHLTCLHWILSFLSYAQDVMVPFLSQLIPIILSSLASPDPRIKSYATETNIKLFKLISELDIDDDYDDEEAQSQGTGAGQESQKQEAPRQEFSRQDAQRHSDALREGQRSQGHSPTFDKDPAQTLQSLGTIGAMGTPGPLTQSVPVAGTTPSGSVAVSNSASTTNSAAAPGISPNASTAQVSGTASASNAPPVPSAAPTTTATAANASPTSNQTSPGQSFSAQFPSLAAPESQGQGQGHVHTHDSVPPHVPTRPPSHPPSHAPSHAHFYPPPTPFDFSLTVTALTMQFLNENEETRLAALEWLLMLHNKSPRRVLAADGSNVFGDPRARGADANGLSIHTLLSLLNDQSEQVLRLNLQLLAQIASTADHDGEAPEARQYSGFQKLMTSLLGLFSTDRALLETRGAFIVRELCACLNSERIYRTFAELLERDEDLEFASLMVQNLNVILATSPELADLRKRLRALESRDGQSLFIALYRSWCHNAVSTFTLCLLAQAYEHAYALLQIFADMEMTVALLIQVDRLVQLIESPIFTSLRLQLLEPEKNGFLLKAMYGLLMLLPQSSAFATLRNRLSVASSLGQVQTLTVSNAAAGRGPAYPSSSRTVAASIGRRTDDIRWSELLIHFRQVQKRKLGASHSHHPSVHSMHVPQPRKKTPNASALRTPSATWKQGALKPQTTGAGSNSAPTSSFARPSTNSASVLSQSRQKLADMSKKQ